MKETEREVSVMMGRVAVQARQGAVILAIVLLAGVLTLVGCGTAQQTGTTGPSASPATLSEQLEEAGKHLDQAISDAQANNIPAVTAAYQEFNVIWLQIEDPIWKRSEESQIAIQKEIDNTDNVLLQPGVTPDKDRAVQALQQLRQAVSEQVTKLGS